MFFYSNSNNTLNKSNISPITMNSNEINSKRELIARGLDKNNIHIKSTTNINNKKHLCLCDKYDNNSKRRYFSNLESSTIGKQTNVNCNQRSNYLFFANRFLKNKQIKECSVLQNEINMHFTPPESIVNTKSDNQNKSIDKESNTDRLISLLNSKHASPKSKENRSALIYNNNLYNNHQQQQQNSNYYLNEDLSASKSLVNGVYAFHLKYMNKKLTSDIGIDHNNLIQPNYYTLKRKNNQRALNIIKKNTRSMNQDSMIKDRAKPLKKDIAISANFPTISSCKQIPQSTKISPIRRIYDNDILRDREIILALRKSNQDHLQRRIILFNKELNKIV